MTKQVILNHNFSPDAIVTRDDKGVITVDFTARKSNRLRPKPIEYANTIQSPRIALVRNPLPYARMHRFGKWRSIKSDTSNSSN